MNAKIFITIVGLLALCTLVRSARVEVEDAFSSTNEQQDLADFDEFDNDDFDNFNESGGDDLDNDKDGAVVCHWADESSCETCCLNEKFVNHNWNQLNGCTCDVLYEESNTNEAPQGEN